MHECALRQGWWGWHTAAPTSLPVAVRKQRRVRISSATAPLYTATTTTSSPSSTTVVVILAAPPYLSPAFDTHAPRRLSVLRVLRIKNTSFPRTNAVAHVAPHAKIRLLTFDVSLRDR